MSAKRILVVTGTRAEYGLLRSTMDAIQAHPTLNLSVLVTGMHTIAEYGNTAHEIVRDGYPVSAVVAVSYTDSMLEAYQKEVQGIGEYCVRERPDCVLVLGDRPEVHAAATVAAHLNIPVAHIHGGDSTGPGIDEMLRHVVSKMAHMHFVASAESAERVKALGEESWRIHNVGTVAFDEVVQHPPLSRNEVANEVGLNPARPWITVLQHPTYRDDTPLETQISETLTALEQFDGHERVLIYPNSDTGTDIFQAKLQAVRSQSRTHVRTSLPRQVYLSLLRESVALVGNSSSGIIEISMLGTLAVDIGNRQHGRECGEYVIHVPYAAERIRDAIKDAERRKKERDGAPHVSPYGEPGAGNRIVALLATFLTHPDLLHKKDPLQCG